MKTQKINLKKLIRPELAASAWHISTSVLSRGLTLLMTPVFTRLLSPEEYAIYPLYVSFMGIFTVIITLEVSGNIIYTGLSAFRGEDGGGFLLSAVIFEGAFALFFSIIYIIFKSWINAITGLGTALTLMLIIQVFLNSLLGIYFSEKRYKSEYARVAAANLFTGIFTPILSLLMIRMGLFGISRVLSPLILSFIIGIPIFIGLMRHGRGKTKREHFSFLLKTAFPLLPHYISLSVMASGEKIIIARLIGEGALGKYSVAHSVGISIALIFTALLSSVSPKIIKTVSGGDYERALDIFKSIFKLSVTATLLFLTFTNEVFKIAAPKDYYSALFVIFPTALAELFSFLTNIWLGSLIGLGSGGALTRTSILSATAFILLAIPLTRAYGIFGGSTAPLISSLIRFFLTLRLLSKRIEKKPISVNYCLYKVFSAFTFAGLIFSLSGAPVSRILLASALLMMLLWEIKNSRRLFIKERQTPAML